MSHAADAFRAALREAKLTQQQLATRAGISRPAIIKFLAGRPLSPRFLTKICGAFPSTKQGKNVILGHLQDEVVRAGFSQEEIWIVESEPTDFLIREVRQLVGARPERATALLALISQWKSAKASESNPAPIKEAQNALPERLLREN